MTTKTRTTTTPRMATRLKGLFGFTTLPFTKDSDPDRLFRTEMHTQALDRLRYLLDRRGTGAIFGAPGSGKSILLNTFIHSLGKAHYAIAYVTASKHPLLELTYADASTLSPPFFNIFASIRLGCL